jgi:hypothetical protein
MGCIELCVMRTGFWRENLNVKQIKPYSEVLSGYQPGRVVGRWTNRRFEDHFCPHPQGCDVAGNPVPSSVYLSELRVRCYPLANGDCWGNNEHGARTGIRTMDWIPSHVTTLTMTTEIVLETLVCSRFNHSNRLITRKNFTVTIRRESARS